MISLEEAKERVLALLKPLAAERLPLSEALGRFASAEPSSAIDLPRFDNSAMDGYAVHSSALRTASSDSPVVLRCTAKVAAGESASSMNERSCVRLFTGSPLPAGADAVVMQEDVSVLGNDANEIRFTEPVKPFENVRLRGEDVRNGAPLVRPGEKLTATRIGLLAATGCEQLAVHQTSSITLLPTGSELREPGEPLAPGEIYESNRTLLQALLSPLGARVIKQPPIKDDLATTVAALERAFAASDAVISTGGVSVGEFDFVKEAFQRLGGTLDLWKIAIRPGKPFMFGRYGEKILFGLPGNPVSAFVTFLVLVRPAILKLHGASNLDLPTVPGELTESVRNPGDRRHFLRVRWQAGKVSPAGPQKSHMLGGLAGANGLVDVPPGAEWASGSPVTVQLWELPEGG